MRRFIEARWKGRVFALLLCGILLATILPVYANESGQNQAPYSDEISISTEELAAMIREEFADRQTVEFTEPLWNVARNHVFYVDFDFELNFANRFSALSVYLDTELTRRASASWRIVRHRDDPSITPGHSRLYLSPGTSPAGRVLGMITDNYTSITTTLEESGERYLHETGPGESWGMLSHFYLVQRIDSSGLRHRLPQVTIFTVDNQLEAPQSEFFVTDDGRGGFRWYPIEGADYYLIVRFFADTSISGPLFFPFVKTTETSWTHPARDTGSANWGFLDFERSRNYGVIAVNSETHSSLGTVHIGNDIHKRLPFQGTNWLDLSPNTIVLNSEYTIFIQNTALFPTHQPITMADRTIVYRRMVYDFDSTEVINWARGFVVNRGPDGEPLDNWTVSTSWHIPFLIEGTPFSGVVAVDISNYTHDIDADAISRQIEEALPLGGFAAIASADISRGEQTQVPPSEEVLSPMILVRPGDFVYANSPLSAFLARNMLAANRFIDLTEFPESANWDYLVDAFFEAIYQNPLILHVRGISHIPGSNVLEVYYRESVDTIVRQQQAIRQIVPEIIAEIITPDMSDLEKSIAINHFLVDTTEYDWSALENAELHNFMYVDARYNDAFTAYGILINQVGVCAGYAAAYQLLAHEAGLQAIVVTGYLEGFLPHAWNRVYIDGHWHVVDVTNNASELLPNIFLHLPDAAVRNVLVQDRNFVLDDFLVYYRSIDSSSEYFKVTGRFYPVDAIAYALARDIRLTGSATLRTDFDLSDFMFGIIALEVMALLETTELYGAHWLGLIWMGSSQE